MGEVADGDRRRCSAVLVEENNIAEALALGGSYEFGEDEVTAIEPDSGREEEPDLFGEGH